MSLKLLVGPFPHVINKEEKEKLLYHFGAEEVIHIARSKKGKEVYAIAIFESQKDCEYALQKVHQIEILGVRISAKYCNSRTDNLDSSKLKDESNLKNEDSSGTKLRTALQNYEAQLSSISSKFGINNPINPKLRYSYPSPTPVVLCNIAHNLASVPKFYIQVLHLMNKMNLPCPFGPLTEEPPLCKEAKTMTSVFKVDKENRENEPDKRNECTLEEENIPVNPRLESDSESESEIESDEEIKSLYSQKNPVPKRTVRQNSKKINKKRRLEIMKQTLLAPKENLNRAPKDSSCLEEVFEMSGVNPKKKLSVKVQSTDTLGGEVTSSKEELVSEGFGKLYPQVKDDEKGEEPKKSTAFISEEELSKNRIPAAEWPIVPVFKNYTPGTPSSRLYLKNLAKTTTAFDLRHIFGEFLAPESDEEATKSNIRLMKEGRMKGQAFVTFPSMKAASMALEKVNGYILKDKPIVIVFGKVKPTD